MTAKTPQTNKTKRQTTPKRKQSSFSFTRKELFLWLGVVFLSMVWMFILGIVVGRGLSPVRFDVEKLKQEIVALRQEALQAREEASDSEEEADERHLGFYDILTEKKEMARLKTLENAHDSSSSESVTDSVRQGPEETGPVDKRPAIRQLKAQKRAARQETEVSPVISYTLQIASFRDLLKAQEFVSALENKGYDAYQVAAHVDGKGTYHRVRIGHFPDKQAAGALLARLKEDNLNPLLIQE